MTARSAPARATPRRSNAVLAAFSGPCLPLAAFGVALPVTLPEFYATFVGLELGVVAAVFMAVRLIDIVFDPFIGWGMDKTRTRFGRYRPWMALSTPMLMLAAYHDVRRGPARRAASSICSAGCCSSISAFPSAPWANWAGPPSWRRSMISAAASTAGGRCSTSSAWC